MNTFRNLLIAAGFLIIVVAGVLVARQQIVRWASKYESAGALSDLGDDYRVLQALRGAKTNEAIDLLERRLDSDIFRLNTLLPQETDPKKRAAYIRALARVREYRLAHPWKSGTQEIDEGVEEALSSIPEQESKK